MTDKKEDNLVFIGDKKFIQYIRAIEFLFRSRNFKNVILKARGKNILMAINLAEACKKGFIRDLRIEIKSLKTDTESFKKEDEEFSVSSIEIELIRK